ncbi:mannosyl-oligosaccharide alpha-1,2-mannosidase [Basidiobolus meristosporus CBS 931.73]|uniref:alpha-1,2-Mannosidase n=1 Tax=Basidiobolus meristosporus CBS 931.73 TaxID=1314790 RepID=A0A1Y1Y8J4_9FUNG|nr:mannosyl-oligosaccharide alpha-1,2-mannosidase [Basidiobolus meristosporus CBS 931.73]|eukprot:ORX94313.1 mannosyl-oligosaccharide alpha-1,2-mannosidase [Basidiobolus meristosporus CBS 931.73]
MRTDGGNGIHTECKIGRFVLHTATRHSEYTSEVTHRSVLFFQESRIVPEQCGNDLSSSWQERRSKVAEAFRHAWGGYTEQAFGFDEYHPVSKTSLNIIPKGMGYTIIDSLDTMLLMNLTEEFNQAREWISTSLDFNQPSAVNVFETTIRVLGGLLSSYHLSGDKLLLDKAVDLGDRLLGAFESPSGIPYASVMLDTGKGVPAHFNSGASSTAEATTLQLEFKYLSYLTGDKKYWNAVEKVMAVVDKLDKLDGLVPIFISPESGAFWGDEIRLGSRGDSYYEYLLKQWLQTTKQETRYRDMYDEAVDGIKKHLLSKSQPSHLTFVGEVNWHSGSKEGKNFSPKMDHLVCFLPGTLALGVTLGEPIQNNPNLEDLQLAKELLYTCWQTYTATVTGLGPEIVYFNMNEDEKNDIIIKPADAHNLLRPETIESIFYMWRITKDPKYRDWGWRMFLSFEKYCKVASGGYSSIDDVTVREPHMRDNMETFFLAETLKYFYLLFSDDNLVPIDQYVFNTEAHPFPIFNKQWDATE